jgi:hypothetical protein
MAFVSPIRSAYSTLFDNYTATPTASKGTNDPDGTSNMPTPTPTASKGWNDPDGTQNMPNSANSTSSSSTNSTSNQPQDPPITANSDIDQAIAQLLAQWEAQLDKDKKKLDDDKNAAQSTQDQIDAIDNELNNDNLTAAQRANLIKKLNALKAQLAQQQSTVNDDQSAVDTDQAVVDACKMILYSDQANSDKSDLDSAWQTLQDALQGSGINLSEGDTLTQDQYNQLTDAQKAAYNKYLKALKSYVADSAAANKYYADLQKMASHSGTAGDATNAIDTVNNAIASFGVYYNYIDAIDPNAADKNADDADKAAQYWYAVSAYLNALADDDYAKSQLAKDQANADSLPKYEKDDSGSTLTNDYNAVTQADNNLQNAETNLANLQKQMLDQASPDLKKELAVAIAQQNLNDAEAFLAEVEKMTPEERRRAGVTLADAQAQVDAAKAQLAEAQKGNWQAVTQFTQQDLQAAIAQVQANHKGETVAGQSTSDLINEYGWEFAINREAALIQSAPEVYLTKEEQALWNNGKHSKIDINTLAFLKLAGVSINTEDDAKIALANPLAYVYMKLGNVKIDIANQTITIDGTAINVDDNTDLLSALQSGNTVAVLQILMSEANPDTNNPYVTFTPDTQALIQNLELGTVAARLDYVKSTIPQMVDTKNPGDPKNLDAFYLLTLVMKFAFTPQEQLMLWQQAGAPYFTEAFFKQQFKNILGKSNLNVNEPGTSGRGDDEIGKWLIAILKNSNGSYEVAEVILNAIKDSYNSSWLTYINANLGGASKNLYTALSMAFQNALADPYGNPALLTQQLEQWLTATGPNGVTILQQISGGSDFSAIQKAIASGYGDLSYALYYLLKTDNSDFAQQFCGFAHYDAQQAQDAQTAANNQNAYNSFNPQKDVPTYFKQFNDNTYIDHGIHIGSGPDGVDGTKLADLIGMALGLTPTDPDAKRNRDYSKDWYAEGSPQRAIIDLVIGWIKQEGGANATFTILPMVYAASDGGVQYGALFDVKTASGQTVIVDGSAAEQDVTVSYDANGKPTWQYNQDNIGSQQWHFSSVQDYQENNSYSRDGTIYLPVGTLLPGDVSKPVYTTSHSSRVSMTTVTQPLYTNGPGYVSYQAHTWGWKDTVNIARDVAVPLLVMGVTLATGGLAGPFAILIGTAAGFVAYEATDAVENGVTLAQGDKLNDQQISLLTPLTNNWGQGAVTDREWHQAWADALGDLINSFGAAAGAQFSAAISAGVSQGFAAAEARTLPAILARFGANALTLPADDPNLVGAAIQAGYGGLLIAPEGASAEVLQAVAAYNVRTVVQNAFLRFLVRAIPRIFSGAAGSEAAQLFIQPAGFAATTVNVIYQESEGLITQQQGEQEVGSAFDSMLFNLEMAPVAGAFGGFFPNNIAAQGLANLFINTGLTEGNEFRQGGWDAVVKNLPQDAASILLNTGIGMISHGAGGKHSGTTEGLSTDPVTPRVTVTEVDQQKLIGPGGGEYNPSVPVEPDIADGVYREYDSEGNLVSQSNSNAPQNPPVIVDEIVDENGVIQNAEYIISDSETEPVSQSLDGEPQQGQQQNGSYKPVAYSAITAGYGLDGVLRQTFGPWISPDKLPAFGAVFALNDQQFEDFYRSHGGPGEANQIRAMALHNTVGVPAVLVLRGDLTDTATILHEFLHYYSDPAFREIAQSFEVVPGQPHSNLSEGVTEYLLSKVMPGAEDRPYSIEASVAETIFHAMGDDGYEAYFQGDPLALATFKHMAEDLLGSPAVSSSGVLVEASMIPSAQGQGSGSSKTGIVYPTELWPWFRARVESGYFNPGSDTYVYAVQVPGSQVGQPLSFTASDVLAQGSLAAGATEITWQSGNPVAAAEPQTVFQEFGTPPVGQKYGFVVSGTAPPDLAQNGLTGVPWELDVNNLPQPVNGEVYKQPRHADFGFKFKRWGINIAVGNTNGDRYYGALLIPTLLNKLAGTAEAEPGRYVTPGLPALVGKAPIPPQDDAIGLKVADAHNHPNSFPHPNYLMLEKFVDRLTGGIKTGLINGQDLKITLSSEIIPYLTRAQGGGWQGYTAPEALEISSQFAYRDDWKFFEQVQQLKQRRPEVANLLIPSITGIETFPVASPAHYGSGLGPHEYIGRLLLSFPDIDPIVGEINGRKEIKSVKDGRTNTLRPMTALEIGRTGTYINFTLESVLSELRWYGLLTVLHNDWGQFEVGTDGQAIGSPSDGRDFFGLLNLLMRQGIYDLSGFNFADPSVKLTNSEVRGIIAKGPVPGRNPLNIILAHFGIGNYERPAPAHLQYVKWAVNHPLLQHVSFDSSWLPSIEGIIARPKFYGEMTDLIASSGRIFYAGDVTNFQTFEQWSAPWYAQQGLLRTLERQDQAALVHYAGGGFLEAYNRSLPQVHWARYQIAHEPGFQQFIAEMPADRKQNLQNWLADYEATHPEVIQGLPPHDLAVWGAAPSKPILPYQNAADTTLASAIHQIVAKGTAPQVPITDLLGYSGTAGLVTPPGVIPSAPALPSGAPAKDSTVQKYLRQHPFTKTQLQKLIALDGKPYSPEAIDAADQAAKSGANRYLQLVTLIATDLVQERQEALVDYLKTSGDKQVKNIAATLTAVGTIFAAAGATAVGFGTHIPDFGTLLTELGQAGNATRSGISIARVLNQQSARKYNEAIQEQGIVTLEMINSIMKRVKQLGPGFGLSPARFTGEGGIEDTFAQFVTDVSYLLSTNVDTQGGITQDMRHALIQSIASGFVPRIDRSVGFSWTSLEPTNFRTVPGRILALVTAVAYGTGVVSNVMGAIHYGLDPRAIPSLALALAGTTFAAYQAAGGVSGAFHGNWADTPQMRKVMSRAAWPTLAAGTWGASAVNLYNAIFDPKNGVDKIIAHLQGINPILLNIFSHSYVEAGLLGLAAAAVTHVASMGWKAESGGGVRLPRRLPTSQVIAALALIALAAYFTWKKIVDAENAAKGNSASPQSPTATPASTPATTPTQHP